MEAGVGLRGVVITLHVVTSLGCVIRVNYNVVKDNVGQGPVFVARTMAKHRSPAQLENPSWTPLTLHGQAFLGRRAVTERKGKQERMSR